MRAGSNAGACSAAAVHSRLLENGLARFIAQVGALPGALASPPGVKQRIAHTAAAAPRARSRARSERLRGPEVFEAHAHVVAGRDGVPPRAHVHYRHVRLVVEELEDKDELVVAEPLDVLAALFPPGKGGGNTTRERRSIRFRLAPRTYDAPPCGPSARVVSLTESRDIPTPKKTLPPFLLAAAPAPRAGRRRPASTRPWLGRRGPGPRG